MAGCFAKSNSTGFGESSGDKVWGGFGICFFDGEAIKVFFWHSGHMVGYYGKTSRCLFKNALVKKISRFRICVAGYQQPVACTVDTTGKVKTGCQLRNS